MAVAAGAKIDQSDFTVKSWTPTFNMTTLGTGNTLTGWYVNVGGLVTAQFHLIMGTGAAFSATCYVDLPFAANVPGLQSAFGSWVYRDQSAVTHYAGTVAGWDSGGTQVSFSGAWSTTTSIPNTRIGATGWVAAGVGDTFSAQITYRAA